MIKHPNCNGHRTKLCIYDCTYCYNKSFASSIRATNWSKKNGDMTPRQVFKKSHKKCWFDCDKCHHSFDAQLSNVTGNNTWCPYCTKQKLCDIETCDMCFNNSFSSHEKSKYWSKKNGNITPRQVFKSSGSKYWFDCDKCTHDFDIKLNSLTSNGHWCSYCSNPPQKMCDDEKCIMCFNNSFASHKRAANWSKENGIITPRQVFKKTTNCKYWFDCDKCHHIFDSRLADINNDHWCPYCNKQKLCEIETCNMCFENSFASSIRVNNWSKKNGNITPRQVFKSSGNKYWFDCNKCHHIFDKTLANISEGQWCSYCASKKLCDNDKCFYCYNKSFASSIRSMNWSKKNGNIIPRKVFKSSHDIYEFDCDKCSLSFPMKLNNITNNGNWCPICKNKTEKKLHEILSKYYRIIYQPKYNWCTNSKTDKQLPFDFELPEYKIIIELDGDQHFKQVSNWGCPEEIRKRDIYKMDCANKNGYTVIRIYQLDVWMDKNNWLNRLIECIKIYESPNRIFISSGEHYNNHKIEKCGNENFIIKNPMNPPKLVLFKN